ncbi:hypothetical protein [Sphingopyxis sp.]|uniref:hypothetical protein n=1 Tax=Sphingopyxis sp. TaxID=1908224 RepID=UPI0025CDE8CB|nr:hypothetical protein [Sphingopyxis sp.]MBK6412752.1 hypothetical protein [Sphingopyxis sp.]
MSIAFALMLMSGTTFDLDPAYKPVRDQLAPARAGQIQCHEPDTAARTCRIMTWLSAGVDGRVQVRQLTALSDSPALAAELRMTVTREGDAICGVVNDAYMAGFRIVGSRAPHAPISDKRYTILYRDTLVGALWNRKTCAYAYARPDNAMQIEVGTVDGEFAGEMMSQYIWISPGAGYRLKARPPV